MTQIVGEKRRVISFVPVIGTSAFTAGWQLGGINKLAGAVEEGATASVISIALNDASKQKSAIDLLFFNALPTVASVDSQVLSITAAEMTAKYLGRVKIPAASYGANDTAHGADVAVTGINLLLQGNSGRDLYCVLQAQGTPTYAAATDITVRIGLQLD